MRPDERRSPLHRDAHLSQDGASPGDHSAGADIEGMEERDRKKLRTSYVLTFILQNVQNLLWIIVEDTHIQNQMIIETLDRVQIPYIYILCKIFKSVTLQFLRE